MADRGRRRPRESADDQLALLVARGKTVRDAAAEIGMPERTAYRRSTEPEFQAKVRSFRRAMVEETLGVLTAEGVEAAKTLGQLQRPGTTPPAADETETPAGVRVQAARAILDLGGKYRQELDYDERLRRLEEAMGLAQQGPKKEGGG
jgi:hypothetical protein